MGRRREAKRFLVACEGKQTEPQYIEGLVAYLRSREVHVTVQPLRVGKDPLSVVRRCVARRDQDGDFDACVCLVDVDQHASLRQAVVLAQRENIILLVSRLKFEQWLRWHAEDARSALDTAALDRRVTALGLVDGKRLRADFPYSKVDEAYRVAKLADPDMAPGRIGPDPSSAMPLLLDLMRQP